MSNFPTKFHLNTPDRVLTVNHYDRIVRVTHSTHEQHILEYILSSESIFMFIIIHQADVPMKCNRWCTRKWSHSDQTEDGSQFSNKKTDLFILKQIHKREIKKVALL